LIKNCKDTFDAFLRYTTSEKSNVLGTKSYEAERIQTDEPSNSFNANLQVNLSPHVFNTDSIKKLTSNKLWSRFEEVILTGVVFDRFFARGSLTNACPELMGSKKSKRNPCYTWNEITEQYNASLKRFKGGIHPDRTSVALMRHYKVMKHRLRKDVPDFTSIGSLRRLYQEYESLNLTDKGEASPKDNVVHVCDEHGVTRHVPASDYNSNANSASAFMGEKYTTQFEKLKEQRHAFMDQLKEKSQSKEESVAEVARLSNFNSGDKYTRPIAENTSTHVATMKTVDTGNESQATIMFPPNAQRGRSPVDHGRASHQQVQMYLQAYLNQQIIQQQMQMQFTQQQLQGMVQVPVHMAHQLQALMTQGMYTQMAPLPIYAIPAMQTQHVQPHMQRIESTSIE